MTTTLIRRIERLERDLMPERSGPCFVMVPDDAAAEREIEQLEAEYGDRLPKVMFIMTLARPEDRDRCCAPSGVA